MIVNHAVRLIFGDNTKPEICYLEGSLVVTEHMVCSLLGVTPRTSVLRDFLNPFSVAEGQDPQHPQKKKINCSHPWSFTIHRVLGPY